MWSNSIASFGADSPWCLPAAFALDLALGDPRWLPHPVRLIGLAATYLERLFVYCLGRTYLAGLLFTTVIVAGTWAVAASLVVAATAWDWRAGLAAQALLLYTTLAARDLDVESGRVYRALADRDLVAARGALSMIVGRDTQLLNEAEVVRAAVETVAESSVDGVVAPLVFALVGGAPAAMAYKAVNTLDSMVGHRDERYIRFGWASARLDDLVNFVPARLARLLYPLASLACGYDAVRTWRVAWRDGGKSPSPNAGISEAAVAGALGVRLGGTNFYDGVACVRPYLGESLVPLDRQHVRAAIRLMYCVSALTLLLGLGVRTLLCHVW
ncbi:MAG TPA: adenosylcobinamide-phosphate synthase CbiB [Pirellulales bacterium]|jgi:adenosylcobinamide-phosphate synthase|nr:adenosylcobinamide-phosphate synthase CbiB [Pirellulales bacterium]